MNKYITGEVASKLNGTSAGHIFESHGHEYQIDINGAIKQLDAEPFIYDDKYCSTYDTEEYRRGNEILQTIRLAFATATHDRDIKSLYDCGYGNGAFMRAAKKYVRHVSGYDVTGIEVEDCQTYKIKDHYLMAKNMPEVDVITFFDCLEHIDDITFVQHLPCETLIISLPWCHYRKLGKEWFDTKYKHLKPSEHIWHFDFTALINTMRKFGWNMHSCTHMEDIVRVSPGPWENILTAGFKR